MKKTFLILAASLTVPCLTQANITTDNNGSITAIFGTGNPDHPWSVVTDSDNNLQLGLRAKQRFSDFTGSDGNGNYNFAPGTDWNIEFSVNVDANGLTGTTFSTSEYTFFLDIDGGLATFPLSIFNGDNSFGNNNTANSAGIEQNSDLSKGSIITLQSLLDQYNVFQNSERNIGLETGGHTFVLSALDANGGVALSDTITVNGGYSAVPEPSTYAAASLMLLPLGMALLKTIRRKQFVVEKSNS
jgi:hypothetical protein